MSKIIGKTWNTKFSKNVFMALPRLSALVTSPIFLLR